MVVNYVESVIISSNIRSSIFTLYVVGNNGVIQQESDVFYGDYIIYGLNNCSYDEVMKPFDLLFCMLVDAFCWN